MLQHPDYPRSNRYDKEWIVANQMGFNPLWLTEWICRDLVIGPEKRVLDLGCGKALSSIYLAREYGARVFATDLRTDPTENYERARSMGVESLVVPIRADARGLPFAHRSFDLILCIDAYIYFGTDDLYLGYVTRFLKQGGMIAIAVPGFMGDPGTRLPDHLHPFWSQECWSWHTLDWWKDHWSRTDLVKIRVADVLPDGWKLWLQWKKARAASGEVPDSVCQDIAVLESDAGRYMGFHRLIAEKA